jgi:hypothetical protein
MARLRPILTRCSAAQAVLSCLLAGLVLTSSLPAPAFPRATFVDAMTGPSEGQDSLPDDTESPEDEPSSGEVGLQTPVQRRSRRLSAPNGIRASRLLWPWTVLAASRPRPWWLTWFVTGLGRAGHFLAEGRALRLWFQSQTC